mgnify:FL=1
MCISIVLLLQIVLNTDAPVQTSSDVSKIFVVSTMGDIDAQINEIENYLSSVT